MVNAKLLKEIRKRKIRRESELIIIKTPEQIEGIRRSCKLAAKTLDYLNEVIFNGVTTREIDRLAEQFIRDHGAIPAPLGYRSSGNQLPYPNATCISLNEVICHGIPGDRILKDGDILNVDITTILNGFYGDTSRMYAINDIDEEAEKLMEMTFSAMWVGISQVKPGNHFGNIGYRIAQAVEPAGYSIVTQYCGHGVGLQFHEAPQINHKAEKNTGPIMQPGMIFTIEPMLNTQGPTAILLKDGWTVVTKDGGLSAQYEHTILVTDHGYEVLTESDS